MARRKLTPEDEVRKTGGRKLLRRPDEVDIARTGRWVLAVVTGWGRDGWHSFKLIHQVRARKNVYYLGWNGERIAKNKCAGILREHNPEIYAWAEQIFNQTFADKKSA